MAIRYSRRQPDGTVEHYDSKEEMEARNSDQSSWIELTRDILAAIAFSFNPVLAAAGFFIGGALCIRLASRYQAIETWIRFVSVIFGSLLIGYISGKFGNILIMVVATLLGVAILAGGGLFVWQLL
jgi:hypothetical protein